MRAFAKGVCSGIVVCLTAYMFYCYAVGSVIGDQLHVWQRVWGIYVWADAYSGFALFSLVIFAFERRLGLTIGLLLLACCTGNMVNATWLLWRGPELFRRITANRQGNWI